MTGVGRVAASCGAVAMGLAIAECGGDPEPGVLVTVTASPSHAPLDVPELLTVAPTVIEGIDVQVQEELVESHYTYTAIPMIPNAVEVPELNVSWDIVGSSPEAVGVRLHTQENGRGSMVGPPPTGIRWS